MRTRSKISMRIGNAFHRPKIGQMHQDAFAVGSIFQPPLRLPGIANIDIAIHEVVDHLDVVLDVELPQRALAQILRDGSYAVALLDRETSNREDRSGRVPPA